MYSSVNLTKSQSLEKYLGSAKLSRVRKGLDKTLIMQSKPHRKLGTTNVFNWYKPRHKWLYGKKATSCMKLMTISVKVGSIYKSLHLLTSLWTMTNLMRVMLSFQFRK